jgi:hypothetical protein
MGNTPKRGSTRYSGDAARRLRPLSRPRPQAFGYCGPESSTPTGRVALLSLTNKIDSPQVMRLLQAFQVTAHPRYASPCPCRDTFMDGPAWGDITAEKDEIKFLMLLLGSRARRLETSCASWYTPDTRTQVGVRVLVPNSSLRPWPTTLSCVLTKTHQ